MTKAYIINFGLVGLFYQPSNISSIDIIYRHFENSPPMWHYLIILCKLLFIPNNNTNCTNIFQDLRTVNI